jgi:DUF2946 family protein
MRRRLRNFLPIVLMALVIQVVAPVAACWAVSIVTSDPLHAAVICHDGAASTSNTADQTGQPRAHDGCCSVCSVAQAAASIDAPQTAVATPYFQSKRVVWLPFEPIGVTSGIGSLARARGPPQVT